MDIAARRQAITFLVLTYAFSSIFYALIISAGSLSGGGGKYVLGLMWCPGIAALLTRLIYQRNLRGFGWGWGKTRYQAASYLIPLVLSLVVYGIVWATGIGGLAPGQFTNAVAKHGGRALQLPILLLLFATVGVLSSAVSALGEEIGWRGLLVPELAKLTGFTGTAVLSGAAWSLYHYPLILFANYNGGTPAWYSLTAFTWMVMAASFVFAWLRLKSGSLWTGVILHASHNLFIQAIFDAMTVDRGATKYVTSEFGVGLAIAYTLVAWYCWRRRGELPQVLRTELVPPAAAEEPLAVH
jgi:membrane protease YdiL (CAAX protease family)